jgi:hypothetical protein
VPGHFVVRRDYPSRGRNEYTSLTPRVRVPRHVARLVVDYFDYAARPGTLARRAARHAARRATRRRLLRRSCASGCLSTSRGSSRRSSSTTSPTPRVRVPRHVARLVMRLVIDYFAYAARSGASARRAARHAAHRRLHRLRRASVCLGMSCGSSRGSSSNTSPTPRARVPRHVARLVVDHFTYVARPGASACHAARRRPLRHVARLVTRLVMPLVVDFFAYAARPGASARRTARRAARCRLLHLHRAPGCLGTSCGSSLTTSPTPRARVPQHVARLVVDYSDYAARPGASARHAARRRLLRLRLTFECLGTSRCSSRGLSRRSSSTSFTYAVHLGASAHCTARRAARRRLLHLRRAPGCLGTSRGSSSTTSTTPHV